MAAQDQRAPSGAARRQASGLVQRIGAPDHLARHADGIEDRDADVWEALLAVAKLASGEWPERAHVAAVALVTDLAGDKRSLGVQLLADLRAVFGDELAMHTETILGKLNALEDSPWGDLRGKPLDARGLARRLRKYDVHPGDVRLGNVVLKGYKAEGLADAWSRYLPAASATSATTEESDVADVADVADSAEANRCTFCGFPLPTSVIEDGFNAHPTCG